MYSMLRTSQWPPSGGRAGLQFFYFGMQRKRKAKKTYRERQSFLLFWQFTALQ